MICRYKIKFISDIEQKIRKLLVNIAVAPFVGVWIEILLVIPDASNILVAPFVGVWIEIITKQTRRESHQKSLPSWECGLKLIIGMKKGLDGMSLPSWECGLKYQIGC